MAFRFRKSKSLGGGLRANLGKKSASLSWGLPGLRVTAGTSGVRVTGGIPGTGISITRKVGAKGRKSKSSADGNTGARARFEEDASDQSDAGPRTSWLGLLIILSMIAGAVYWAVTST